MPDTNRTIAIATDEPQAWHTRELRRAFARRGYGARSLDLRKCRFDLGANASGLVLPGFSDALPAAVFVRGINAGTLEQVVLRLDFLHALRELGVPVYNDARAIERSVDKAMTSFLLHRAGVPTPATWATEDEVAARRVVMRAVSARRSLVAKPLFGSQGQGVRRVDEVPSRMQPGLLDEGVAYLQSWLPPPGDSYVDWRVLVVGGQALAAMRRESEHWVTNIAQGAQPRGVDIRAPEHAQIRELAMRAADALAMDYSGVDLMRGPQGNFLVIEVNGVPAWRGLQRVTSWCIADAIAGDLIGRKMGRRTRSLRQVGRAAG